MENIFWGKKGSETDLWMKYMNNVFVSNVLFILFFWFVWYLLWSKAQNVNFECKKWRSRVDGGNKVGFDSVFNERTNGNSGISSFCAPSIQQNIKVFYKVTRKVFVLLSTKTGQTCFSFWSPSVLSQRNNSKYMSWITAICSLKLYFYLHLSCFISRACFLMWLSFTGNENINLHRTKHLIVSNMQFYYFCLSHLWTYNLLPVIRKNYFILKWKYKQFNNKCF